MDFGKNQQQQQPSVKLHHAPGGQSSFSLAWDDGSSASSKPKQAATVTSPFATHEEEKKQVQQTSVKYSGQAPGGSTTISLGDGSTGDNRFVTQNQANSAFATNTIANITTMAADVDDRQSTPGRPDQVEITIGRAVNRSCRLEGRYDSPVVKKPVVAPTKISGAASPRARATDRTTPVRIPGAAYGST